MDAVDSGAVQEKQRARLVEIIRKVNGLFEGELTDDDQIVYVNGVLEGKLPENDTLVRQAASNRKEQFADSPALKDALLHAIMDALDAHTTMGTQALGSERLRGGLEEDPAGAGAVVRGPARQVGRGRRPSLGRRRARTAHWLRT